MTVKQTNGAMEHPQVLNVYSLPSFNKIKAVCWAQVPLLSPTDLTLQVQCKGQHNEFS